MLDSIYVKTNINAMENNVEKALNNFIGTSEEEEMNKSENVKKQVLTPRGELIERVDKIFVTQDGRQLLREQY
jgi:hypothetical protein